MERVQAADPAGPVPLAEADQVDQTLQWILAQPRETRSAPARSIRPLVGWAASAALTVGAVTVALWPSAGGSAFASWVPAPVELDQGAVAASAAHCGEELVIPVTNEAGETETRSIPVAPVLAEKRGDHTFVLLEGDNAYVECIVTEDPDSPHGVQEMQNGAYGATVLPDPPSRSDITVLAPGQGSWGAGDGTGEGSITTAYGTAGPDVESIDVTTSNGVRAQASVSNGWWAVWFPGNRPLDPTVTIATTDGQTRTADLTELWPHSP